jgi:hypothetical protein
VRATAGQQSKQQQKEAIVDFTGNKFSGLAIDVDDE